jgi:hypothetical protein
MEVLPQPAPRLHPPRLQLRIGVDLQTLESPWSCQIRIEQKETKVTKNSDYFRPTFVAFVIFCS